MVRTTMSQHSSRGFLACLVAVSLLLYHYQKAPMKCPDTLIKSPSPPQQVSQPTNQNTPEMDADTCRTKVFVTQNQGGLGVFQERQIKQICRNPMTFDVCGDLKHFTGLNDDELLRRLRRIGHFHFEGEHMFWNPQTSTELAWYYSTSTNYLFANAFHPAVKAKLDMLVQGDHEPVLDYSGGVGNNILYLAQKRGMKSEYFGIGLVEKSFAQFRVNKRGLQNLVTFRNPWSVDTGWTFDTINGGLARNSSLGAILAMDVLEHIPNYHLVVEAMVDSLKIGGVIVENSPFAKALEEGEVDTRVHVSNGGVSMSEAMGARMRPMNMSGWWTKIKE